MLEVDFFCHCFIASKPVNLETYEASLGTRPFWNGWDRGSSARRLASASVPRNAVWSKPELRKGSSQTYRWGQILGVGVREPPRQKREAGGLVSLPAAATHVPAVGRRPPAAFMGAEAGSQACRERTGRWRFGLARRSASLALKLSRLMSGGRIGSGARPSCNRVTVWTRSCCSVRGGEELQMKAQDQATHRAAE